MKILIVGGSGFVGRGLAAYLSSTHEVVQTTRTTFVGAVTLDASDLAAVAEVIAAHRPQAVVNAAGYKDVRGCEQSPLAAFRANVEVPAVLAVACRAVGCKLAHVSTDLVFGSGRAPFAECDRPEPITVYSNTKLAGELACCLAPNTLIIRVGGLYGPGSPLLREAHKCLGSGKSIVGYTNARNTPTSIATLARALERLLLAGERGLFHVADTDSVSRYELLVLFAEVYGYDRALVQPAEAPYDLLLPSDVSLRSVYHVPEAIGLRVGLSSLRNKTCV